MNEKQSYMIITLCGSTRFQNEFQSAANALSLNNYIVLMPHVFSHYTGTKPSKDVCEKLGKLHIAKIDMSDAIMVINKEGYIGESTKEEIEYAKKQGKDVYYRYIFCNKDCKNKDKCKIKKITIPYKIKYIDKYPNCPYSVITSNG